MVIKGSDNQGLGHIKRAGLNVNETNVPSEYSLSIRQVQVRTRHDKTAAGFVCANQGGRPM